MAQHVTDHLPAIVPDETPRLWRSPPLLTDGALPLSTFTGRGSGSEAAGVPFLVGQAPTDVSVLQRSLAGT